MVSGRQRIRDSAITILERNREGLRFMQLYEKLCSELPDIKEGHIWSEIHQFPEVDWMGVYKPERGLYKLIKYGDADEAYNTESNGKETITEDSFYEGFANYLMSELDECREAIPFGGKKNRDKWGTPDVIGVDKPDLTDPVKYPQIVVSAEIKTNPNELITALGQACAYLLFSHKVYLVVPVDSNPNDLQRVELLCQMFGIGLVTFNRHDNESPEFQYRLRASSHEPSYFHLNSYVRINEELKKLL